jgi:hypothetical protein
MSDRKKPIICAWLFTNGRANAYQESQRDNDINKWGEFFYFLYVPNNFILAWEAMIHRNMIETTK